MGIWPPLGLNESVTQANLCMPSPHQTSLLHPHVPRDGRENSEATLVLGNLASQHGIQYNHSGYTGGWEASLKDD